MPCKKAELVSAINSFGSARVSADPNLQQFAVNLLGQLIDTLELAPEDDADEVETVTPEVA